MKRSFSDLKPPHQLYEQKYRSSRMILLLVVLCTAINLILLVAYADTYFLFSAFIPYYLTMLGMVLCGRYPESFYEDIEWELLFLDDSFFVSLLVVSILLTALYLLAFFLSKKQRVGWLIFALVFFSLDTIGMLLISGIALESILDVLFHGWVIYDLSVGIRAHYKLKNLPAEEEASDAGTAVNSSILTENSEERVCEEEKDSPVIRAADKDVKHRVLAEAHFLQYDICYRRVKHTNELVINGNVYDEIEGVMEHSHILGAYIDGHEFTASYTGTHSVIAVDGEALVKKIRWY